MAMPLYDGQPTRRAPVVTYLVIAVNVVVFLLSPLANIAAGQYSDRGEQECAAIAFLAEYAAIPQELTTNQQLPVNNELTGRCQVEPYDKQPLVSAGTAQFLHGSWFHLLSNMVFLFIFGAVVEDRLGRGRYLLFYLIAGYLSVYGFALTYPDSMQPLVGASGAISGVLGAYLMMNPRGRIVSLVTILPVRIPAWVFLGVYLASQWLSLAAAEEDQVAYLAHIYGFVAGMAYGLLARYRQRSGRTLAITRFR